MLPPVSLPPSPNQRTPAPGGPIHPAFLLRVVAQPEPFTVFQRCRQGPARRHGPPSRRTANSALIGMGLQSPAHQSIEVPGGCRQLRAGPLRFRDGQFLETILKVLFVRGEGSQYRGKDQPGRQRRRGGPSRRQGVAELVILHQVVPELGVGEARPQFCSSSRSQTMPDGWVPVRGAATSARGQSPGCSFLDCQVGVH